MLGNGVSAVIANGKAASMNTDNGQQWAIPVEALQREGSMLTTQRIDVEVRDVEGQSYGTFRVTLDPQQVQTDCAAGKWASVAVTESEPPELSSHAFGLALV